MYLSNMPSGSDNDRRYWNAIAAYGSPSSGGYSFDLPLVSSELRRPTWRQCYTATQRAQEYTTVMSL